MRREFIVPDDAADEARRRLLRDLHDGLGPALAAIALGLRAARHLAVHDPASAGPLLARLEEEVHTAVNDVRRLASGACPAVLARLGLAGAVRAHVASLADRHPVRVDVRCADVPELPAHVQVAAYRIICEALTNVVRHAGARHCSVRLRFDGCLHVEVVDDGVGLVPDQGVGVGLGSMRDRAREVGGTWRVEHAAAGGTLVAADLPLSAELPRAAELPPTAELLPATGLPHAAELPLTAGHPRAAELPLTAELPDAAELPRAAGLPHAAELPLSAGLPHAAGLPRAAELPLTAGLPDAAELPFSAELPRAAELPLAAKLPVAAELPLAGGV